MHIRFLTIPYNQKGMEEYDCGIQESNCMCTLELPDDEFETLLHCFETLNKEFGLLIDDYESEMIADDALIRCKEIIETVEKQVPVFNRAVKTALRYNTVVFLDF